MNVGFVFFAIVNMCELVNCRPHGQTTRMTVKLAPKTCPEPSEPRTPTLKAITKDWTYQNKIIKRDTKTYYILSSIPFYLESQDLRKPKSTSRATLVLRYQKAMKILEKYFPLEAVSADVCRFDASKLGALRTSHHRTFKSNLALFYRWLSFGLVLFKDLNQINLFLGFDDEPLEFGWFHDV